MELAHAVRQEASLAETLAALAASNAGTRRGAAAERLGEAVASGMSISQAVKREGKQFGPGVAVTIEAGERCGNLAEVMDVLAENARAEWGFRDAILVAVTYPLAITLVALLAVVFINFRLWPMFGEMFDELDVTLPALTRLAPTFLQFEAFLLLLAPASVLIVLYIVPSRLLPFRAATDVVRMRLPVVGTVMHSMMLSRWCRAMAMLISARVDEPAAVRLSGESVGNACVKKVSGRVAKSVSEGTTLADAMTEHWFFPEPLVWVVGAGGEAGGHAHVWETASSLYENRAETTARVMSVVLRVAFVLLALQIVAVTVVAVLWPLMHLMNSLGG